MCSRWYIRQTEQGRSCYLRSAKAGYSKIEGATVGLGKTCVHKDKLLWDTQGLNLRCIGDMFQNGMQSEHACKTFCAHDAQCDVYQMDPFGSCWTGQSRNCFGEAGWTGGRKKPSGGDEMKTMCDNFNKASDLQQSGSVELEPALQSAVDMSQSTCFQSACGLANADTDCGYEAQDRMKRQLVEHCESIPMWKFTNWSRCYASHSSSCGDTGFRKRTVTCSHQETERCRALADEPANTKPCTVLGSCEWVRSDWSACHGASTCSDIGIQTRTVSCNGPESACFERGLQRPRTQRPCSAPGCDDVLGTGIDDRCTEARRLHALWSNISTNSEESELWAPAVPQQVQHGRSLAEDQIVALSVQECATLSATAGYCAMVTMSDAGLAGFDFQMSACMSKQLDEILEEVGLIDSKIDTLKTTVADGFKDLNDRIDKQTEELTGAMQQIAKESVDELQAHGHAVAHHIVAELEKKRKDSRAYLRCTANANRKAVLSHIDQVTGQLTGQISLIQADLREGFQNLTLNLKLMEGRLQDRLSDAANSVIEELSDAVQESERKREQFIFQGLSKAVESITGRIKVQTDDVGSIVRSEVSAMVADVQTALSDTGNLFASKAEDISDSLIDLLQTQTRDDVRSIQDMVLRLSKTLSGELQTQSETVEAQAVVRSKRLEQLLAATIETASSEKKAILEDLKSEVVKGREAAVSTVEEALNELRGEVVQTLAVPMETLLQGTDRIALELDEGFAAAASSMSSVSTEISENQKTLEALASSNAKLVEEMESANQAVAAVHADVLQLNQEVLAGQQRLAESIAALNMNLDSSLSLAEDVLRQGKDFHLKEVAHEFKASSLLIDGAFLDFNQHWLPNATAQARQLLQSFTDYVVCRSGSDAFAESFDQGHASKVGVLSELKSHWRIIRDHFAILSSILVDGQLLRNQFDTTAVAVRQEEVLSIKNRMASEWSSPNACGGMLGPEAAKEIRSLLLQKMQQQPLTLARRVSSVWKQVSNMVREQRSMGSAVSAADLEYVRKAYVAVLNDLMHVRDQILGANSVLQQFHTEVLDMHLPFLCPPPPSCTAQILTRYRESRTNELVVWREIDDAVVVIRRPSEFLRLQGVFAWDVNLADESSLPMQLPPEFVESVYLCQSRNGRYSATRVEDADASDAFRFCSIPGAGVHSSSRCGQGSYGQFPIDSWTPGSGVTSDLFTQWEEEARAERLLSAECGNGIVEFGEFCDEGPKPTGACRGCVAVEPGWERAPGKCQPKCGDGLVFAGVEECDDGGLLIGCTSGCRLAECQRLDTVAKPMSSDDLEMKMMWMQAHQMPQPPSSDLLDMQGYRLCFQFTNDGSGTVSKGAFTACRGESRLTFLTISDLNQTLARYDVDLTQGPVFDVLPGTAWLSGPHQLRVRFHNNSDHELVLSCRVAADDWDSCVLWSVREGIPETRPGFSDEAESISFLIYAAPPEIRWDCSNRTVPDCGDGHLTGSEDCDDGNSEDFDGCSANCTLEAGFICQSPGSPCIATTCGDGVAGLGLPQKFY